jgi:sugar lactone lactonase YvrE
MNTFTTEAFRGIKAGLVLAFTLLFLTLFTISLRAQTMTTIAGVDSAGFGGDKSLAVNAALNYPDAVSIDAKGNIFIGDDHNSRIRMIDGKTGVITTLAGTGEAGFSGDGGLATQAAINGPTAMAFDKEGNVYFGDEANACIRKIDMKTRVITTVAGDGEQAYAGDGEKATDASFIHPSGLAIDDSGNMYIADWGSSTIRKVNAKTGIITTIAGTGEGDFDGDGGPAVDASLSGPNELAIDKKGNLYVTDSYNNRIRKIDLNKGTITTVAGTGDAGYSGNGSKAIDASLNGPTGIAIDTAGNIFFSDWGNNCIRFIDVKTGVITVVAGNGESGFGGDGGPAEMAQMTGAEGLALNAQGDIFIADNNNNRIRKVEMPHDLNFIPYNADNDNILLYPNPANNVVNVKVNEDIQQGSVLVMYNITGQQVWITGAEAHAKNLVFSVSTMPTGIYFVKLQSPDGTTSMKKLVVTR